MGYTSTDDLAQPQTRPDIVFNLSRIQTGENPEPRTSVRAPRWHQASPSNRRVLDRRLPPLSSTAFCAKTGASGLLAPALSTGVKPRSKKNTAIVAIKANLSQSRAGVTLVRSITVSFRGMGTDSPWSNTKRCLVVLIRSRGVSVSALLYLPILAAKGSLVMRTLFASLQHRNQSESGAPA